MLDNNKHILRLGVPLLVVAVGLITTGCALAASGSEAAVLAVGDTNLAMVLGLSGAAALIASGVIMSAIFLEDQPKTLGLCAKKSSCNMIFAIIGLTSNYFAVHLGIAQLLHTSTIWESLGEQAAILLLIAALITIGCITRFEHQPITPAFTDNNDEGELEENKDSEKSAFLQHCQNVCAHGLAIALTGSAAATLGPALTATMGAAASDGSVAMAFEITIAIGVLSFSGILTEVFKDIASRLGGDHNVQTK